MADEFSVSEESRERAERFANQISGFLETNIDRRYDLARPDFLSEQDSQMGIAGREMAGEAPIADVVADARAFNRHLAVAETFELPLPVMSIPEIGDVPVLNPDLEREFPPGFPWGRSSDIRDWWFHSYGRIPGATPDRYSRPRDSLGGFHRGLALFLGVRFEGFRFWRESRGSNLQAFGGAIAPGTAAPGRTGFHIQLFSRHPHLAAYASPAYALTWRGLGSYTIPANGVLPPGAWIFGGSGSPLPHFAFDPNPVFVPPTFTPSTTCF